MRRLPIVLALIFLLVGGGACSKFGFGGSASPDELGGGMGEGNIPLANAGSALADVHFAFDSSALAENTRSVLRENSKWLLSNSDVKVTVEGHCDERGTAEYNLALGERRARAVKDFLITLGVSDSQLKTISYGEELPLDPSHNEEAWAKNRRVHFAVQQ